MISLVNKKYDFMIKKYWKKPINFTSLTFKTKSRLKANIVGQNKNKNNDKITHFLQLGGYYNPLTKKMEQIDIPIKFDDNYHLINKIKEYKQTYTVKYNYLTKKIERFDLVIELETNVLGFNKEDIEENDQVVGIDVNTKHNLMATSSRQVYILPWDDPKYVHLNKHYKKKILSIVDRKRQLEIKKQQNNPINESEYLYVSKSYENIKRRIKKEEEKLVSLMIDNEIKKGTKCITYEDLNITNLGGKGSKYINHKNNLTYESDKSIKQERYNKLLDISSMKEKISRISTKKGLRSVMVPAPLTSITCNVCKFSHKDNRKEQESFKCLSCGYKENADFNSSDNIKSVYTNKHLKDNLLFYDEKIKNYVSKKNLTITSIRQVYEDIV
jgi:transposase